MAFITKAVEQLQTYLPKSEPLRALTTSAVIGASIFATVKIAMSIKGCITSAKRSSDAKKRRAAQKKGIVYLFGFPKSKDGQQLSTPVDRVESYLKLKNIPYEFVGTMDSAVSDTERLPCVELNGVQYTDSKFIIDELEAQFNKVDPVPASADVDRENTATHFAILAVQDACRVAHYRHCMIESPEYSVKLFTENLGFPEFMVRQFIMKARKRLIETYNNMGHGDLTVEMFNVNFLEDIKSLEYFVAKNGGSGKFILGGDVPTKIDCLIAPWIKTFRRPECLIASVPAYAFLCASPVFKEYLEIFDAALAKTTKQ